MVIDAPVFLIFVAVAGLFKWLARRADERRIPPSESMDDSRERTEEEKVRRFMEALGQPTTSDPAKVRRRSVVPKRMAAPRRPPGPLLPPLVTRPAAAPPPTAIAPPPSVPQLAPVMPVTVRPAPAALYEVSSVGPEVDARPAADEVVVPAKTGLAARLANAQGARDAIVLREIFGPPRGLQTSDAFSSLLD